MILQYNPFRVGPTDLSKVLIQAFIHLGPRDLSKVLIYAFIHLHTFQIRSSQSSFSMGFFTSQHFGFHFARFPYQPSEPWIPDPCDAPKLRRLTGNIHLNGWGSAAVQLTKPNKSRGVLPGLETSSITIMDFLKDLGGNSWVAHTMSARTKHPCQVEDVSILLPGNANQ